MRFRRARKPSTVVSALVAAARLELFCGSEPWVLGTRAVIRRVVARGYVDEVKVHPAGQSYYLLNDHGRRAIGILEPSTEGR